LTQLESFKPMTGGKAGDQKKGTSGQTDGDHATYELFYRPEQAHFSRNAKVASLEERLERLEAAMGNTTSDKLVHTIYTQYILTWATPPLTSWYTQYILNIYLHGQHHL